jgi:hypothetical protein
MISVADPDPGSGIRCLFDPWIRDPGRVESQHPHPGFGIRDEQPESYFLELTVETIFLFFLGLKFFNADTGSGIRDGDSSDPGSGMEKSRIRDPG